MCLSFSVSSPQYSILRRACNRPVPIDMRAVSHGAKIQTRRKRARKSKLGSRSNFRTDQARLPTKRPVLIRMHRNCLILLGGRTRARTWDPPIRDMLLALISQENFTKGPALETNSLQRKIQLSARVGVGISMYFAPNRPPRGNRSRRAASPVQPAFDSIVLWPVSM
jgi:hypothetical protein